MASADLAPSRPSLPDMPTVVIQPTSGWAALNLRELWRYRDLLFILAQRDVKLRYKQTALGVVWVVLQPLVSGLIFAVIFGRFANLPSGGVPYLLFVFCGLVAWTLFAGIVQRGGNSLIGNSGLIAKVYFPRLLIPFGSAAAVLVDFGVSLALAFAFMLGFQYPLSPQLAALPLFFAQALVCGIGVSLWLGGLNVRYRDFAYALPFVLQVWLYVSPVVYSASIIPERWRGLYALNPAAGFIEGFRWSLVGASAFEPVHFAVSALISIGVFVSGLFFFRRVERGFADVV